MNKKIMVLLVLLVVTVGMSETALASSSWNLEGTYEIQYKLGSTPYNHIYTIDSMDLQSGAFSGTGYYVPDPSYTETISGTVTASDIAALVTYTGSNLGYTVTWTASIFPDGTISGSAISSTGQSFTMQSISGNQIRYSSLVQA
jgi:hypothetical protein